MSPSSASSAAGFKAPVICEVSPEGPAGRAGVPIGSRLLSVNGEQPRDILEYYRLTDGRRVNLELEPGGRIKVLKREGEPLGIAFDEAVFDGVRICRNRCVFCFIDQMPRGLRPSFYMKDDDYRLSLLWGNFVTLTNLSSDDRDRIIAERISPLFVSVHTTDSGLHQRMVRPRDAGASEAALQHLSAFVDAGLDIHVQIVLCPGWNDGDALLRTLYDLAPDGPIPVASIGIVPVGLTSMRSVPKDGGTARLTELSAVTPESALRVIEDVTEVQRTRRRQHGFTQVYLADEFYLKADRPFPPFAWYDDFPQLGNGIGLCARFLKRAGERLGRSKNTPEWSSATILTGEMVVPVIREVASRAAKRWGRLIEVLSVPNHYFGGGVSITPLLTSSDVISGLEDAHKDPASSLGAGPIFLTEGIFGDEGVTLDGVPMDELVARVASGLGLDLRVLPDDGGRMIAAMERCPR